MTQKDVAAALTLAKKALKCPPSRKVTEDLAKYVESLCEEWLETRGLLKVRTQRLKYLPGQMPLADTEGPLVQP